MKIKPITAHLLSAITWFAIGTLLLYKGLNYLMNSTIEQSSVSKILNALGKKHEVSLFLSAIALFVGFLKGRFVLSKTAKRFSDRFYSYDNRLTLKNMYPTSYFILLGLMMFLGFSLKFLPISRLWLGFIDVAIGSALVNGGMQYLRNANKKKTNA